MRGVNSIKHVYKCKFYVIKTCEAGLVLSVTRILRAIPCVCVYVCMYVCMWSNSSQTTEPICIKIIPANRAFYADCYRLIRFEIFTKYDEYFAIERTPFLNNRSFATAEWRTQSIYICGADVGIFQVGLSPWVFLSCECYLFYTRRFQWTRKSKLGNLWKFK